jgi:hydroxymethylpyrimidine pyrophosphatase-like HAD family hydrolase
MNKIIAVDFDGTLCKDAWPEIGTPNEWLIRNLIQSREDGHSVILWTCRTGEMLEKAVQWCNHKGLIFDAINENVPESIERFGGDSRKVFADVYIDDKATPYFLR